MVAKTCFTLVEALSVAAIFLLLFTLLNPTLNKMISYSQQVQCAKNLRHIGVGVNLYVDDHGGRTAYAPNGGSIFKKDGSFVPVKSRHASWAARYHQTEVIDKASLVCPSMLKMADFGHKNDLYLFMDVNYALNPWFANKSMSSFESPSTMIMLQDHYEHRMDSIASDTLALAPGKQHNLLQWREGKFASNHPTAIQEVFRHQGKSQILWVDGHASNIAETLGHDVPVNWYVDGFKVPMPK